MIEGKVIKSTGSWYEVLGSDGKKYNCRLQGKFRQDGIKEANPVALGERVKLIIENNDASIAEILPRENHILRQSVKKTGHSHVLAANVDQVLLVATIKQPRTSAGFIDRFFVSAESFRIPQILLINKADLLDEAEMAAAEDWIKLYESIGVRTWTISALTSELDFLKEKLHNKTTLVAGHSGVGKSTLLNRLIPGINQTVNAVSEFTMKGTHTTTFAEMFLMDPSTFIIDTPGIKEWGLVETEPQEISDYFPEMRELRLECKFGSRCLHLTEPHCAVRVAVETGKISPSRYNSYVSMATGADTRQ